MLKLTCFDLIHMPVLTANDCYGLKALRSLSWYMSLVPALLSLLMLLFQPSALNGTRSESGYWALMWIVAKLGLFVWVLRQLLRYALFHWMTQLRRAISYSPPTKVRPVTNDGVGVRESSSNRNSNLAEGNSSPGATTDRWSGGRRGLRVNDCHRDVMTICKVWAIEERG